jgi:hypothetical protein
LPEKKVTPAGQALTPKTRAKATKTKQNKKHQAAATQRNLVLVKRQTNLHK